MHIMDGIGTKWCLAPAGVTVALMFEVVYASHHWIFDNVEFQFQTGHHSMHD